MTEYLIATTRPRRVAVGVGKILAGGGTCEENFWQVLASGIVVGYDLGGNRCREAVT